MQYKKYFVHYRILLLKSGTIGPPHPEKDYVSEVINFKEISSNEDMDDLIEFLRNNYYKISSRYPNIDIINLSKL